MKTDNDAVDLDSFLPTEDSVLEIMSQDGRPTGWKITLAGPSHTKVIAFADAQTRRNLHKAKLIEQAQVNGKKYQAEEKTPDEQRRENTRWVIARILEWTPVKIGGVVHEFSDKAAEDLLIKPEMGWAYLQIAEAINEDKRFTKPSAKP
ncbi:hypothetical protein [Allomesorhizobium camelthorni]|uniref:Uncharacterized protein n=1 Tax=Allomesorhizobium camelthorni TaxID=475069 RepID=A0A6G4W6P4_9HYPH|nr:hypothetical protein [Mesorhizobium camelthorni]NGO50425.1 hypothetical protein [Mesorhizobium camelthorni]